MKTIQYMGSKKDIIPYILNIVDGDLSPSSSFFDCFSGSGRVSYALKDKCKIIANDKQEVSKTLLDCYLCNPRASSYYQDSINYLNSLGGTTGWFTNTYACFCEEDPERSTDDAGNPKLWQIHVAEKIDAIRSAIDAISEDHIHKQTLLTSLILAASKVSNTVGHQNGYLRKWAKCTYKPLILEVPEVTPYSIEHDVLNCDIFDIASDIDCDIAYIDPPYGTANTNLSVATRYSSFYHAWNTIVRNDQPETFGKANKPIYTKGFTAPLEKNNKDVVAPALTQLLKDIRANKILFSYSNQGLLSYSDIFNLIEEADCLASSVVTIPKKENNQKVLARKEGLYIANHATKPPLEEVIFCINKK